MRPEHASELVGQTFALVVALTVIGCSTYVIAIGHPVVGGIGCSATLVSLVTAFIIGRKASVVVKPDVKATEPVSPAVGGERPA